MKTLILIGKIYLLAIGAMFLLLAGDVFDIPDMGFFEHLGGYFIESSPGIVIILTVLLLWKRERIIGVILLALVVGTFFLFKPYVMPLDKLFIILAIEVPLLFFGTLFISTSKKWW